MNFRQQNSLTFPWLLEFCRKFPDFLGKFPDFQRSLSNSLTFPGFPGQWQPCIYFWNEQNIHIILIGFDRNFDHLRINVVNFVSRKESKKPQLFHNEEVFLLKNLR